MTAPFPAFLEAGGHAPPAQSYYW